MPVGTKITIVSKRIDQEGVPREAPRANQPDQEPARGYGQSHLPRFITTGMERGVLQRTNSGSSTKTNQPA